MKNPRISVIIEECENGLIIVQRSHRTEGMYSRSWVCEDEEKIGELLQRIFKELREPIST